MDDFLATARGRLLQLKALRDAGKLDAATYESQRLGVEREIGDRLLAAAAPAIKPKPSRRLVVGLGVAVLVVAAAGYRATGSPSLLGTATADPTGTELAATDPHAAGPDAAASGAAAGSLQQIAAMVDKLATRMKDRPDDVEGWTMLARSYTVLGRFGEALPAYRRAADLQPKNPGLLADFADAVAATKGSANNPESLLLVERALAVDPTHPKALALAGTAAFDRGDYSGAIARWQEIADRLPADSALGKQVQASIVEARELAAAGAPPPTTATTATPARAPAPAPVPIAAASAPGLSGTVTLDAALAAKASPADTVFVFARAASGSRMPLAVQRAKVADLPLAFKLDDSMAMAPGTTLSSARQVILGARISKSGNAVPQAGDLSGEVAPVAPGTTGISIRIDRVVGPGP